MSWLIIRKTGIAGLFLAAGATTAGAQSSMDEEINHLIGYVGNSGCSFIRNGSTHSPAEAARHIQRKYDYFSNDVQTAEDFIELSASKSSLSGKAYQIACPGRKPVKSKQWLMRELSRFRAGAG